MDDENLFPDASNLDQSQLEDSTPLMQNDTRTGTAPTELLTSFESNQSDETVVSEKPEPIQRSLNGTTNILYPKIESDSESEEEGDIFEAKKSKAGTSKDDKDINNSGLKANGTEPTGSVKKPDAQMNGLGFEAPPPVSNFESSDEDSDEILLFQPKPREINSNRKPTLKLEDDDLDSSPVRKELLKQTSVAIEEEKEPPVTQAPEKKPDFMSMFADWSDDDDDFIFGVNKPQKQNMFAADGKAASAKKPPQNKPTADVETAEITKGFDQGDDARITDNDQSFDDPEDTNIRSSSPIVQQAVPSSLPDKNESKLDDEVVESAAKAKPAIDCSESSSDDDGGFPNAMKNKSAASKNMANIFTQNSLDSDDGDDMFTSSLQVPKLQQKPVSEPVSQISKEASNDNLPQSATKSNIGSKDSVVKETVSKKPEPKPSRRFSTDSDEDLFKTFSSSKSKPVIEKKETVQTQYSDDDDLFAPKPKKETTTPRSKTGPAVSAELSSNDPPVEKFSEPDSMSLPVSDPLGTVLSKDEKSYPVSRDVSLPVNKAPSVILSDEDIFAEKPSKLVEVKEKQQTPAEPEKEGKDASQDEVDETKTKPAKGKVAQLGNKLNLTASMLRAPGAPMSKTFGAATSPMGSSAGPSVAAGSFSGSGSSGPAGASTGLNVTEIGKDKAKLGPRRRPPSRLGRAKPTTVIGIEVFDYTNLNTETIEPVRGKKDFTSKLPFELPEEQPQINVIPETKPEVVSIGTTNRMKAPEIDIFNDSNLSEPSKPNPKENDVKLGSKDIDIIDIFDESIQLSNNGPDSKASKVDSVIGKGESATKKKKAQSKTKTKKSATAKLEKQKKNDDIFDTPDDIFDD